MNFNNKIFLILFLWIIPLNNVFASSNLYVECPSSSEVGTIVDCGLFISSDIEISAVRTKLSVSNNLEFIEFKTDSSWQGNGDNGDIALYTYPNQIGQIKLGIISIKIKNNTNNQTGTMYFNDVYFYKADFSGLSGNSLSKTINVLVKVPLKNISLDKTTGTKNVGEIENLTVTYNPINTTDDKNVTWESSNESIAKVDSTGKVTAIAPGQATITAIVGGKTATYVVDVKQPLTSISLNKATGSLIAEREELLTVTYNPSNTTDNKTITWTTSDPNIATVADGYVKAISAGTATITATVGDKTATYELTVTPRIKLTSISLNKKIGQLNVGEDEDLVVTYNPTDTNDDKTVLWTTSNAEIATVNNGKVTAITPGKVTITATVGNKTASYTIDVKQPLTSIFLNKANGTLRVEGTETLTVTYNPSNTTDNKMVTWSSSDESIAKVENGKITALKVGEVTITATVGGKTAKYNLTVIEKETLQERFVKKGFKIKNSFVHGFKLEDSLTNIKNKVELEYTTTGSNTVISTGMQFKYNSEIFTAIVYGDLNGDGKINSADLLKMRQHLLGTSVLTGAYKEAGSIATGTTINSADLLRIRQHLLGQKLIEQ